MSRSELFAVALAEYLARHGEADITSKLNEVLADEPSGLDPALRTAQARSVASEGCGSRPGRPRAQHFSTRRSKS